MPRKEVKDKKDINSDIFKAILNKRGYNIRQFSEKIHGPDACSDKTLRRALNSGKMKTVYINQIAKTLDVDARYLTGEISNIDPRLSRLANPPINYYLSLIDQYPYERKELDDLKQKTLREHLTTILSLFDFSYSQFESLNLIEQYDFQHELFEAITSVLAKYFSEDAYGNKERPALYTLINDLEGFYEDEFVLIYADTKLREKYMEAPPKGYSSSQIRDMSRDDIFQLDWELREKEYKSSESYKEWEEKMQKKYGELEEIPIT